MRTSCPLRRVRPRFRPECLTLAAMAMFLLATARMATAIPVEAGDARSVVDAWLRSAKAGTVTIAWQDEIRAEGRVVAWVCGLAPAGHLIVSADTDLPPVVAYSFESPCPQVGLAGSPLARLVAADLASRLAARDRLAPAVADAQAAQWRALLAGAPPPRAQRFEQWPPDGATPTGGWLTGSWTQNAPYNAMCPLDLAHGGSRSLAGCPSVAMAMILDYRRTLEGTKLDPSDRYRHAYAGNVFWVPDAAAQYGFPDFETLNGHLESVALHWNLGTPLTSTDRAALVFACGVAARQVYSAAGSGTFGVSQAHDAYVRFGFGYACRLLTDADPELYATLASNMRQARPAHLAVVDPGWTMGHNLVVDGWNTDDYFHLNFGWGGSYNGWYRLPQGMPYGLTVVEGVIVDIVPAVAGVGDDGGVTRAMALACAPNPFNPRTTIRLTSASTVEGDLRVFDVRGRLVVELYRGRFDDGVNCFTWEGRDARGRACSSGAYWVQARVGGSRALQKLVLLR